MKDYELTLLVNRNGEDKEVIFKCHAHSLYDAVNVASWELGFVRVLKA